jgi:two-component system response regulator DctR
VNPNDLPVYVVDDDEAVRKSICYLLTAKAYQVSSFATGEEFLAKANLKRGGCAILDLRLGGMSGLQVFDALRTSDSPLVTVFLSGHGDISLAVDATKKGAFGWIEKPCKDTVLRDTVALAMAQAQLVLGVFVQRMQKNALWQTLTTRERDVAWQTRTGAPNKLIARALGIDVRTVETHRAKVYSKIYVANPTELDQFMRDADLLSQAPPLPNQAALPS